MTTKSQDRVKQTGEVFTPRSIIREMLNRLPNEVWFDPNKRWLEPAAGDGNFLVEMKARLLQAGHAEVHILENMLFSVELIDDNHWALQHRLGYLIDGQPNPRLAPEHFALSKISKLTQDLNDKNPYVSIGCERDEVLHHRNHVCASGLEYDMSFGRTSDESTSLPLLPVRELGDWPETDTPDIGERYVVERMLGRQPQLVHEEAEATPEKPAKTPKVVKEKPAKVVEPKQAKPSINVDDIIRELVQEHWDSTKKPMINRALVPSQILSKVVDRLKLKKATSELQAQIKTVVNAYEP